MTRKQLDRGETADQDLYELVTNMYNNADDPELAILHYNIDWSTRPDPSVFDPIDVAKAKSNLANMASE